MIASHRGLKVNGTFPQLRFRILWGKVFAVLLALSLLLWVAGVAYSDALSSRCDLFLSRKMASKPASGWSSVIVKLDGYLTSPREAQLKALGGDIYRRLPIIHSVALRVPTRSLPKLASLPFVARLSADITVKKTDEFTVEHSGANVAFQQYGLTGRGVGVAVIDTGVHFTNDLAQTTNGGPSRIVGSAKFGQTNTDDFCGHGSHVAGIIAGNGAASTGNCRFRTFYGVAKQANLINVCILDKTGQGTVSSVIAGIQWVLNKKTKFNIRVMNLSLGHAVGESYTTDPLCQAVEAAWKSGIVVVCAAGNSGRQQDTADSSLDNEGYGTAYGSIQSPGNDPYVITVGAMKQTDGNRVNDRIATYSSRGPSRLDYVLKPDIVAPGNQVISLNTNNSYLAQTYGATNEIPYSLYTTQNAGHLSQDYFRLSGTSMAAPVVSGAAALMLQKYPTLTPDTVKARLMVSADKWTDILGNSDPCTHGAGYLNIPAALNCDLVAMDFAVSPTLSQDAAGYVCVDADRTIWGKRAIWGTGITDLRAIWGKRAIWGTSDNILDASRAIWGKSVWFDRAIWGTSSSAVDLTSTVIDGE